MTENFLSETLNHIQRTNLYNLTRGRLPFTLSHVFNKTENTCITDERVYIINRNIIKNNNCFQMSKLVILILKFVVILKNK